MTGRPAGRNKARDEAIRASNESTNELMVRYGLTRARVSQIRKGCPAQPRPTTKMRFDLRVDRSGVPDACWPWMGAKSKAGYGYFRIGGQIVAAHRYAKEQATGAPLDPTLLACHECDNPPCCNPSHIFMGTHTDNSQDALTKGRLKIQPFNGSPGRPPRNIARDAEIRASALSAPELAVIHSVTVKRIYAIRSS